MSDDPFALFRAASAPPRRSIVELIVDGVLDAEIASLAWLLIEARLPVFVGGAQEGSGRTTLLEALLDFLPPTVRRVDLAGAAEDFTWLPEADALGWSVPDGAGSRAPASSPVTPATGFLVAAELAERLPVDTWGRAARTLVRAATLGYGIGSTILADRLEDVHARLRERPVGLTDDELSYLGLVLIMRADRARDHRPRRLVAAHYARPIGRDEHGHTQRLPPAVLASRSEADAPLDHFAWGIMPELAIRIGWKAGDLERESMDRATLLRRLAAAGMVDVAHVRAAIREHGSVTHGGHRHH